MLRNIKVSYNSNLLVQEEMSSLKLSMQKTSFNEKVHKVNEEQPSSGVDVQKLHCKWKYNK